MKLNPLADNIKRITERIINLPTLPTVVSRMIDLVDSPRTSALSLARLISMDQALTARILKLANSAYYGFSQEITTVDRAIVVIGFNTVREMGLSLSILDVFKANPNGNIFDIAKFWEHSIGCGVASRMIARRFGLPLISEAFVTGLLHDIGKIVLCQYAPREFEEIMTLVSMKNVDLDTAEMSIIGVGHAQIGGWLATKWRLPTLINECIAFHHDPWNEKVEQPAMVAAVNLADYLCHANAIGKSGRATAPALDPRIWDIFLKEKIPFDETVIDELHSSFLFEYDEAQTFVSFLNEQSAR
jgi:HD-like signal output (HDOD) protein